MNPKKRLCLLITAALALSSTAYAALPVSVRYEGYELSPNSISVHFNSSEAELLPENLSLSIGGRQLPISSLTTFEESGAGASYLFVADASGSISDAKLSEIKFMLSAIASQLTPADNASFMVLGNELADAPFVSGMAEMQAQIDAIAATHQNTNLYAGIVKGMDILTTRSEVKSKKVMIILSDGEDYHPTGYTREEVNDRIKSAHIPLHTVAMLNKGVSEAILESAKVLGSFARQSSGGLDVTYGLDGKTGEETAARLVDAVKKSYILTADLTTLTLANDQSLLELKLNIEGKGSASDSLMVNSAPITAQIIPPQPESAPEQPPTENAEPAEEMVTTGYTLWVAAGAALALCLLLTVLLVRRKKKKKALLQSEVEKQRLLKLEQKQEGEHTQAQQDMEVGTQASQDYVAQPAPPPKELFSINLTKLGRPETECYYFEFSDEVSIGRSPARARLAVPEDELLSGLHCKIRQKNGDMFLEDMGSTNGTYLNGIPVQISRRLEQDDIILVGSMELRVTWEILKWE